MSLSRDAICAEASSWIGTPWKHQAHIKGVGCDCGGLVGGVAHALGIVPADFWHNAFLPFAGYARQPSGDSLLRVFDAFLSRIDPESATYGDVVVMSFRRDPQHVGILVPYGDEMALVHALNSPGVRSVVQHRLDSRWQSRITHAYSMHGVA